MTIFSNNTSHLSTTINASLLSWRTILARGRKATQKFKKEVSIVILKIILKSNHFSNSTYLVWRISVIVHKVFNSSLLHFHPLWFSTHAFSVQLDLLLKYASINIYILKNTLSLSSLIVLKKRQRHWQLDWPSRFYTALTINH